MEKSSKLQDHKAFGFRGTKNPCIRALKSLDIRRNKFYQV